MDAADYRQRMQLLRNKIQLKKHTSVVAVKGPTSNADVSSASTSSVTKKISKRYKLGERERRLLQEMQEKEKDEDEQEYKPKVKRLKQTNVIQVPVKGILKKRTSVEQDICRSNESSRETITVKSKSSESSKDTEPSVNRDTVVDSQGDKGELPEGFFDDPIQDAKARKVEYVDKMDEEFARFQKEISMEFESSMAVDQEEQGTATEERQLDEIEDQIRAWKKVNEMERIVEEKKLMANERNEKEESTNNESSDDDDGDEETADIEKIFDWRNKS